MIKLYCGGKFPFDYLDSNYPERCRRDYRAKLLGNEKKLLTRQDSVMLGENVRYIGPFYFESDGMLDEEIVAREKEMIEACTHAVFLLDDAACPGTIAELTAAAGLGKSIAVFYIQKNENEETESRLHTPCWFAILLSRMICPAVECFACRDDTEAAEKIKNYVSLLDSSSAGRKIIVQ